MMTQIATVEQLANNLCMKDSRDELLLMQGVWKILMQYPVNIS